MICPLTPDRSRQAGVAFIQRCCRPASRLANRRCDGRSCSAIRALNPQTAAPALASRSPSISWTRRSRRGADAGLACDAQRGRGTSPACRCGRHGFRPAPPPSGLEGVDHRSGFCPKRRKRAAPPPLRRFRYGVKWASKRLRCRGRSNAACCAWAASWLTCCSKSAACLVAARPASRRSPRPSGGRCVLSLAGRTAAPDIGPCRFGGLVERAMLGKRP